VPAPGRRGLGIGGRRSTTTSSRWAAVDGLPRGSSPASGRATVAPSAAAHGVRERVGGEAGDDPGHCSADPVQPTEPCMHRRSNRLSSNPPAESWRRSCFSSPARPFPRGFLAAPTASHVTSGPGVLPCVDSADGHLRPTPGCDPPGAPTAWHGPFDDSFNRGRGGDLAAPHSRPDRGAPRYARRTIDTNHPAIGATVNALASDADSPRSRAPNRRTRAAAAPVLKTSHTCQR